MLGQWLNKALGPADRPAGESQNGASNGTDASKPQSPNPNAIPGSPFQYAAPDGSAKTMSAVLGEIVWLMSQSPIHKSFFIPRTERGQFPIAMAVGYSAKAIGIGNCPRPSIMPVILKQFRLFYDQDKPIGVVFWGMVSDEVAARLAEGTSKLRPQDWKSGDNFWVVETIAPFGGAEEMVKDLKAAVFPDREIRMMVVKDGVRDVRVV